MKGSVRGPTMRKLWLLFTQAVTVTLAALFVVSLVKPDWLAWRTHVVEVRESVPAAGAGPVSLNPRALSFSDAAKKAIPSVVNISATRQVRRRNPLPWRASLERKKPVKSSACHPPQMVGPTPYSAR